MFAAVVGFAVKADTITSFMRIKNPVYRAAAVRTTGFMYPGLAYVSFIVAMAKRSLVPDPYKAMSEQHVATGV